MDFFQHFKEALQLAISINDWKNPSFAWKKAYIASVFAAFPYEYIPGIELKKSRRAKIVPSDNYQAQVSSWETEQRQKTEQSWETRQRQETEQPPEIEQPMILPEELRRDGKTEIVVRNRVFIIITRISSVIFISFRGTALSFADFKADVDVRKVKYSMRYGHKARLHGGFFDAVLECFDEVVEKVVSLNKEGVPVYVTGHSLGAAMSAIFHARLAEENFNRFRLPPRCTIPRSTACYTFGMPRYGDRESKARLPQPFHIFNELDAIPTLPPTFLGYVDSANERCLNAIPELTPVPSKGDFALRSGKGIATVLGISDHRIERYVERLYIMRNSVVRPIIEEVPTNSAGSVRQKGRP